MTTAYLNRIATAVPEHDVHDTFVVFAEKMLAEGSTQSAPLGRAVIGGLVFSTLTTLTVLPAIYALLQRKASTTSNSLNPEDPSSRYYVHP